VPKGIGVGLPDHANQVIQHVNVQGDGRWAWRAQIVSGRQWADYAFLRSIQPAGHTRP